jgi:hypothetical protein
MESAADRTRRILDVFRNDVERPDFYDTAGIGFYRTLGFFGRPDDSTGDDYRAGDSADDGAGPDH